MVAGYSRVIAARMIPTRQSADLLCGHWALISRWGRVPRALVWDNESAVGKWRAGHPQLTEAMNAFRGALDIKVVLCRPGDPEAKGLVERANGYLETSFLPGRIFSGLDDFNAQLREWLITANQRRHRRLQCRPVDLVGRRSSRDARAVTSRPSARVAVIGPSAARSLRAPRCQRLLNAPQRDRPTRGGAR